MLPPVTVAGNQEGEGAAKHEVRNVVGVRVSCYSVTDCLRCFHSQPSAEQVMVGYLADAPEYQGVELDETASRIGLG